MLEAERLKTAMVLVFICFILIGGKRVEKEPGMYSTSCADIVIPALAYKIGLEKDTGWLSSAATHGVLIHWLPFLLEDVLIHFTFLT